MLIIPIKDGENIDRALKRFKRKFDKTGLKNRYKPVKSLSSHPLKEELQFKKLNIFKDCEIKKKSN